MRIENINKKYGDKTVLSAFSAHFAEGKTTAIMGPSGCGKTTLLRLILGLEQPDSGEIARTGDTVAAVFQEDRLSEPLSAVANIRLVCPDMKREAARSLLCRLGLDEGDCDKAVSTLSGGMRRRVALARAVAADAKTVILDEPFSALDAETKQTVMAFLKETLAGKTVLFVTHDEREAREFAQEIFYFPVK
jgi:NitT/TauT family transport system ATP-binding protein